MYKIMINILVYVNAAPIAITTNIVEFDSINSAEAAIEAIPKSNGRLSAEVTRLYYYNEAFSLLVNELANKINRLAPKYFNHERLDMIINSKAIDLTFVDAYLRDVLTPSDAAAVKKTLHHIENNEIGYDEFLELFMTLIH